MKADPKAGTSPPPSRKKLIVVVIMAVLVLGLGGAAGWYFTSGTDGEAAHKEVKAEPPVFVAIEQFTVNLQPENGEQYLQVAFTLEVPGLEQAALIRENMPKVRNRMLLLLSGKTASDIGTPEGKLQLSREIIAALKQPFAPKGPQQQVSDVLYTAFIIQ